MSTLFLQLCACAGDAVQIRVGSGYVTLVYRGLEFTEWLIEPLEFELDILDMELAAWFAEWTRRDP
jgi:hypothetical protein